ncbi:MAG: endonuclease/exonuclease/phosphatase family protein [Solirubrobacteraceae bacterium]
MRILTWNLYHGRAKPPAGRPLLQEFAHTLAGWEWDVALLQEVPPWWPPKLALAAGAQHRSALTSRNSLLCLRRAIASRRPDLIKSGGGGANAILVRGRPILAHARVRLSWWPERRVAHGVALADGTWVVNLHANTHPHERTLADCRRALERARAWSAGAPLVFGGDLNQRRPEPLPGLVHVAGHWVDHIYTDGLGPAGKRQVLDAGALSDHKPLMVKVG